ncbi:GNAT family N-acetyltransferase [Streptomyces sp. MZ04]|nr:GNAT family N-acetyltransferase [Streptomyces sp. MZ04]
MQARAVEQAAVNGAARAVVHMTLSINPTLDLRAVRGRGWRVVRRYHVMDRPLSVSADQPVTPPPGVTLRPCLTEADRRRAHLLVEGAGDAAVVRTHNDRSSMAWVGHLGVLREARGRGLGSFLLRHAFGHYAALGRQRIGLGVDTGNSSGALALYERHGMTLDFAADTWELVRCV